MSLCLSISVINKYILVFSPVFLELLLKSLFEVSVWMVLHIGSSLSLLFSKYFKVVLVSDVIEYFFIFLDKDLDFVFFLSKVEFVDLKQNKH
jgi:uncharacterized membrane protein YcfT